MGDTGPIDAAHTDGPAPSEEPGRRPSTPSTPSTRETSGLLAGAAAVARAPGARRLVGVRLLGQAGDGVLQAALASFVLLSPERAASPAAIAGAMAVLLLPFTIVGPWAAAVLDRFRRRQVLVVASATRAVLALAASLAVVAGPPVAVLVVALAYLSVNRLLLAALSASLPRVLPARDLVAANAVVPTAGSATALAAGALALAVHPLVGLGDVGDARLLLGTVLLCAAAGTVALRIGRDELGPGADDVAQHARPERDLVGALRHLRERRTAARALLLIGAHRLGYGVALVLSLLYARTAADSPASAAPAGSTGSSSGLLAATALVGAVTLASGLGFALAAALTPVAARRLGPQRWAVLAAAASAAAPLVLVLAPGPTALVVAAGLLGLTAQSVKISVDTLVQTGVDDSFRGRVFVLYDVLTNAATVAAAGLAALVLPVDGYSVPVLVAVAAWWVAVAALSAASSRAGARAS
ncbi:MFS transporter [Streptomyces sp. NP160]|uniref:MFS transporter n=1 Tax=Streptomyces sp. NP160 TaxID=2586637 RepID=UPI001119958D|nr:MFS transporter [Streptomyces sp. NP160]TNM69052.1 MFS transporter [Streptomyces sp. NP160]